MPRKFYTILILPHAQARLRKIHFSRNFVVALAVLAALFVGLAGVAPHLILRVQSQSETLDQLARENRKLREEKNRFEASLSELGGRLATIEARAGRLAAAVGLKDIPSTQPAAGGGVPGAGGVLGLLDEEMDGLRLRTRTLDLSFDDLEQAWEERARLLASTPSVLPVQGFFSHGYGWRIDPFTGQREFHRGLDIVAPQGTPIRAPADGVVTRAGRMSGYGKMIHVSHGYGLGTRYGHLSEILVSPGERVKRGDIIGKVGSTGRSTGPHLHYELFQGGRQVDPRKYIADLRR